MNLFQRLLVAGCAVVGLAGCAAEETAPEEATPASEEDELFGLESAAPVLFANPAGDHARYPIVIAHGFASSPDNIWAFKGVKPALEKDGHRVYVARVSPFAGTAQRAQELKAFVDQVLQQSGASKVNIIAHSMGGLDARILISPKGLGYGSRVASVTTISAPHLGSHAADFMLPVLGSGTAQDVANKLAPIFVVTGDDKKLLAKTDVRAALTDISEANTRSFSARYPDDPSVVRLSWAGVSTVAGARNPKADEACRGGAWPGTTRHSDRTSKLHVLLLAAGPIVGHFGDRIPNDGLSTVASARSWGTFQGCIPADHLGDVGGPNKEITGPSRHTGLDHILFYRSVAYDLAKRGL